MTSVNRTPLTKSSTPKVQLIPWDAASPEHVQRLVQQRIACGWSRTAVPGWRANQQSGEINLQWIVLEDSDPERDSKLTKHFEAHPEEREPLIDTAISFGGKPRTIPLPQKSFIPVGHICLGNVPSDYVAAGYAQNEEGLYWVGTFYVSTALQGCGLGRAAMDTIETLAVSEPLNAKIIALNAITKDDPYEKEKYTALGLTIPPFTNQGWYERRGYHLFNRAEKLFKKGDQTGKIWYWDAVFLKKEIR